MTAEQQLETILRRLEQIEAQGNVPLRQHIEQRLVDLEKLSKVTQEMSQTAIDTARIELRERLAGMNEIRGTMEDQADTFARLDDLKKLEEQIKALNLWRAEMGGQASQADVTRVAAAAARAATFGLIGIVLSVVGMLLKLAGLL